jgi:superfamily I DNA and/or RNA helicase
MVAVEVAQIKSGDPGFTQEKSVKKIILEFAKEAYLSPKSKAAINIFKSEPTAQAIFSLDFIDRRKLSEVLQKLLQYAVKVESDPSKNPLLAAFSDVYLDLGNIGIENILDRSILPGLGTVARNVRIGGGALNTYARSADLRFAMQSGDKATITLRDAASAKRF